jgi:prepilin-type N-terminal cleavage/methylation domain-containing protein
MLNRLRQRSQDEGGFTLIELLVVILIIGILAAIAIPSFLNQKSKAYDASAKELARTALTTGETYGTDHGGEFTGISLAELKKYETGLPSCPGSGAPTGGACLLTAEKIEEGKGFEVVAKAQNTGDEFKIVRNAASEDVRSCASTEGSKTGCSGNSTGSW